MHVIKDAIKKTHGASRSPFAKMRINLCVVINFNNDKTLLGLDDNESLSFVLFKFAKCLDNLALLT